MLISVSIVDSLTKEVEWFVNESPRHLLVKILDYVYVRQKVIANTIKQSSICTQVYSLPRVMH